MYKKSFITLILIVALSYCRRSFNVMAPLHVSTYNNKSILEPDDWKTLKTHLATVKDLNVDAVTVDVWWGLVEKEGDDIFDWSYYDKLFEAIINAELNIIPIMSFHKCGGNVGDDYTAHLPFWIWGKLQKKGQPISDLQYVSDEDEKVSDEYISLWVDDQVIPQYVKFMEEFRERYEKYANHFDEINISCGPSGELRYPAYNSHDGGAYPNHGRFQCYSDIAKKSFRTWVLNKYKNPKDLKVLRDKWNNNTLYKKSDINVPDNREYFLNAGDYKKEYGQDFTEWYTMSLSKHGTRLIKTTQDVFNTPKYKHIPIGFKLPGVHWNVGDPYNARTSEITTGLINSAANNLIYENGYINTIKNIVDSTIDKSRLILHFTCLEMGNRDFDDEKRLVYSRAESLVFWLGKAADSLGITIKGENALSGSLSNSYSWGRMHNVLKESNYQGLTILRMGNIVPQYREENGHKFIDSTTYNEFKKLIDNHRN